mmetsp:Transcript_39696/g.95483  ORF Transcript_39696/g.95483 Transcript_39696/m.95483 type:complete len:329 (-) Transcript_39696:301-1287(-)
MLLELLPSLSTSVSKEPRVRSTVYPAVSTVSSSSSSNRFLASTTWGLATLFTSDSVSYIALRRALQHAPPCEIPGSRELVVTSNSSLVGKSQTLPYFPNCPPKIRTLLGTNAAHLNAYSSEVRLLTVRPSSGSSLLVKGKLLELFATTCKYAIRSAMGKSNCTASSVIFRLPVVISLGDEAPIALLPCCAVVVSLLLLLLATWRGLRLRRPPALCSPPPPPPPRDDTPLWLLLLLLLLSPLSLFWLLLFPSPWPWEDDWRRVPPPPPPPASLSRSSRGEVVPRSVLSDREEDVRCLDRLCCELLIIISLRSSGVSMYWGLDRLLFLLR